MDDLSPFGQFSLKNKLLYKMMSGFDDIIHDNGLLFLGFNRYRYHGQKFGLIYKS